MTTTYAHTQVLPVHSLVFRKITIIFLIRKIYVR